MKYRKNNSLLFFLAILLFMFAGSKNFLPFLLIVVAIYALWYSFRKRRMNIDLTGTHMNLSANLQKYLLFIPIGIVLLIILIKSIIVIPAGSTGVYHLFGRVRDEEVRSGMHLVNPLASVTKMSVRTEEYTMSVAQSEGARLGDDSIAALTKEGLSINLDITIFYHLNEDKASNVFRTLGVYYPEKFLRPQIRSVIREVASQYEAKDIYSQRRAEATDKIRTALRQQVNTRGIEIEEVLLRNVGLPPKLTESIQAKLTADQDAQRMDFVLQKEQKEAERKRIEATGQRDSQKIINESLSTPYLEYLYINSLKDREGTIYVPTNPATGIPLFRPIP